MLYEELAAVVAERERLDLSGKHTFNVTIGREEDRQLRLHAADQGISRKELVGKVITEYLKANRKFA